jgi:hypothetical protein
MYKLCLCSPSFLYSDRPRQATRPRTACDTTRALATRDDDLRTAETRWGPASYRFPLHRAMGYVTHRNVIIRQELLRVKARGLAPAPPPCRSQEGRWPERPIQTGHTDGVLQKRNCSILLYNDNKHRLDTGGSSHYPGRTGHSRRRQGSAVRLSLSLWKLVSCVVSPEVGLFYRSKTCSPLEGVGHT